MQIWGSYRGLTSVESWRVLFRPFEHEFLLHRFWCGRRQWKDCQTHFSCQWRDGPPCMHWRLVCHSGASAICHCMQVTEDLVESVHDCFILKSYEEASGLSDHCPIGLTLKLWLTETNIISCAEQNVYSSCSASWERWRGTGFSGARNYLCTAFVIAEPRRTCITGIVPYQTEI